MADQEPEFDVTRKGREGSRWINERPTGEEVAAWFTNDVPMHDGMDAARYVTGVTIIPAKERYDAVTGYRDNGAPVFQEMQALTFTPYIRIDTRVRYFWEWMEKHPEWLGSIVRVPVARQDPALPEGFFYQEVEKADGKKVRFVGCSMVVRVIVRETEERVIVAPSATKMVPFLGKYGEDVNAMMKAETGAIGRALGFAGVLVAPGSGIATAEDVQESMGLAGGAGAAPAEPAEPQLPSAPEPEDEEALRKYAEARLAELQEHYPHEWQEFQEWAQSRKFKTLADVDGPALKGLVRKIDAALDEAVAAHKGGGDEDSPLVDAPKPPKEPAPEPKPEGDGSQQDS